MLAEHKRIDAARCDIEFSCQQCAQAAGIEQRARTDDSARGETGTIECDHGHKVDRIGCDEYDAVEAGGRELGDALADDHGAASRDRKACLRAMRSEEHTSELQSLMRSTYAVFCLKKK